MRFWSAMLLSAAALFLAACEARPLGHPPLGHPPLWRIADEDSEIWLFGTVHVLPADLAWRSQRLDAAFASADELVTEADVSGDLAALAARYGALPHGEMLADRLAPSVRAQLMRVGASLNLPPAEIETMRPWLAALRLSFLFAASQGQQSTAGIEAVLLPLARARGMRLSYLETPQQQIRTLADLSEADQIRFLESTLTDIEAGVAILETTQRAWAEGDTAALERLLDAQMRSAGPGAYEALITRRNRAWAQTIEQKLEGAGRTFYAVGAAHLLGGDSVVTLLRRNGVRVEGP
jgi:uncharacterized protein YbaP (TraB family)